MKTRTLRGVEHSCILLLVTSRDEFGRPKTAEIGFDDTSYNLKGGEEFITAWVPSVAVDRRRLA